MRRREFITVLCGVAPAWPLVVRAQQSERMKRVGLLVGYNEDDTQGQASVAAFRQKVRELGWAEGGNVLIDTRWAGSDPDKARAFAKELVGMRPDVIVTSSNLVTEIVQRLGVKRTSTGGNPMSAFDHTGHRRDSFAATHYAALVLCVNSRPAPLRSNLRALEG